jgi:hypothetical protein
MKKTIFTATVMILYCAATAFAQETGVPLETILENTAKQSENYRETFKNLLADEFKTFEEFDKNNNSEKKTTVKSSFLVYQSGKKATSTAELRNVLEVNGKPIPDSQKRGEEFLAELDKQTTLESELKKLQKESSKFDKTWEVYGLTLNQAVTLKSVLRSAFDYRFLGTENFNGNEVYVIDYQQKAKSPRIVVNEKSSLGPDEFSVSFSIDVPKELKNTNLFLRGKLWIDAKTFQIWREERDLIARPEDPVILLSNVFEYQPSNFGILVPKTIKMTIYNGKKEKGTNKFSSLRNFTMNFDYTNFRQTNVEVKILDDETE